MRKVLCMILACMSAVGLLCINAGAVENITGPDDCIAVESIFMRASGSFNLSVGAHGRTAANEDFPLSAGETVRIRATYDPEDASVDFGLIDPEGIFHYFNVTTGSIDITIEVPESGNYKMAIRNNSENVVRVSGFVRY